MKNLYSPWRSSYFKRSATKESTGCVFCNIVAGNMSDQSELIIQEADRCLALLNRYPYSLGHVLIIPKQHIGDFKLIERSVLLEMWRLKQRVMHSLLNVLHAEAFDTGFNLGLQAGASIPDHLHEHIVPRYAGDTEFAVDAPVEPPDLVQLQMRLQQALKNV